MKESASIAGQRYDAVVVGARCAGAATAMLLARVRAAGTPAITSTSFIYGDETITLPIKPRDGVDALYAPRRKVIDTILAEAASNAGAEVVFGSRLVDVYRDDSGRVAGVMIEGKGGAVRRVGAGIVIGADGRRSKVARLVEAETCRELSHAGGVVYTFWPGLENSRNRWYYRSDSSAVSAGSIPTNDGDAIVFVAMSQARFLNEVQADMVTGYRRVLAEASPELAAEVEGKTPSEPYRGFPGEPGRIRRSHGPGWALVGDAGYFKDPITAHGISDALRDAEFLARAVKCGTDGALAEYQSTRDELSRELFEITDAIAAFDWDVEELKPLHLRLSQCMNEEVEALLGLGGN